MRLILNLSDFVLMGFAADGTHTCLIWGSGGLMETFPWQFQERSGVVENGYGDAKAQQFGSSRNHVLFLENLALLLHVS
jgi:hypothetical protein